MYTELFFDDRRLFGRDGLSRDYGKPKQLAVYSDGKFSTDLCTGFVFRTDDGKYRLIYAGTNIENKKTALMIAKGDDGVHFKPENTQDISFCERIAPNQILEPLRGEEIADIVCDVNAAPGEKYKMLIAGGIENLAVPGYIYASDDLKHWKKFETETQWNGGCEPITDTFYNDKIGKYTIIKRRTWGERRIGHTDTSDFRSFSPYELCIQTDSLDGPLDELYGMSVLPYAGMFVGFPLIYNGNDAAHNAKFDGGNINPQLAYSLDGHHWQRSLRKKFIALKGRKQQLVWLSNSLVREDGNILLYASTSDLGHGTGFRNPGTGVIRTYGLRKDGFICLKTKKGGNGTLITREYALNGGKISVNLKAAKATAAIYESKSGENFDWACFNALGFCEPVPGFGHGDCVPFSGDSVCWMPEFKCHDVSELAGRTFCVEIRITDGEIYSLSGDLVPLMNTEGARFRYGMSIRPEK